MASEQMSALLELERRGALSEQQQLALNTLRERGAAPPPKRSVGEKVLRGAEVASKGVIGGSLDVLDLLGELVQGAASLFGADLPRTDLSETYVRGAEGVGAPVAETMGERVLERTGQEIGAGLSLFAPLGLAARFGKPVSTLGKTFIEPIQAAPGKMAALEAAAATGAGAAAGAARELAPGNTTAEMLAQLGGSVAGLGVPGMAIRAGRSIAPRLPRSKLRKARAGLTPRLPGRQEPSLKAVKKAATIFSSMREVPDQQFIAALERDASAGIEGYRPTTSQLTGDRLTAALERDIAHGSPESFPRFVALRESNDKALDAALDDIRPSGSPRAAQELVEDRVGAIKTALQKRVDDALTIAEDRAKALGTDLTPAQLGRPLQEEIYAAMRAGRKGESKAWNAIDPSGKWEIPSLKLKSDVQDYLKTLDSIELRDVPKEIVGDVIGLGYRENIYTYTKLRSSLDGKAREARFKGEFNKARIIQGLSDVLEDFLQNLETATIRSGRGFRKTTIDPGIIQRYNDAKAYSRAFNEVFSEAPIRDILKTGKAGRMPASAVPEELIMPIHARGAEESFDKLLKSMEYRPEAKGATGEAVTRVVLKDVADKVVNRDGLVDAARLQKYIDSHPHVWKEFPELKDQLSTTLKAQEVLDARQLASKRRGAAVDKSAARLYLGKTPDKIVPDILHSRNPAENMKSAVALLGGDDAALAGMRASFWSETVKASGGESLFAKPQAALNYILKNEAAMRELFDESHIQRMKRILRLSISRAPGYRLTPGAVAGGMSPPRGATFLPITALLSRFYAIERGVISKRFVASELSVRFANKVLKDLAREDVSALLEEALIDPQVAKTLLTAVPVKRDLLSTLASDEMRKVVEALRLHLVNLGAAHFEAPEPEEEPRTRRLLSGRSGAEAAP